MFLPSRLDHDTIHNAVQLMPHVDPHSVGVTMYADDSFYLEYSVWVSNMTPTDAEALRWQSPHDVVTGLLGLAMQAADAPVVLTEVDPTTGRWQR
jgi:hypothetical protein